VYRDERLRAGITGFKRHDMTAQSLILTVESRNLAQRFQPVSMRHDS
jgi:hypothetical protein